MADVLIFDDDPSVGDLMGELLRGRGVTVSHFLSGAGVVQLVQENKPKLVILDIMMPGMDGLTACRTLKSNPTTRGAKIAILTAKNYSEDQQTAMRYGADLFLHKPFDPGAFAGSIGRMLGLSEIKAPPAPPAPPIVVTILPGSVVIEAVGLQLIFDAGKGLRSYIEKQAHHYPLTWFLISRFRPDSVSDIAAGAALLARGGRVNAAGPDDPDSSLQRLAPPMCATMANGARATPLLYPQREGEFALTPDSRAVTRLTQHSGTCLAYRVEIQGRSIVYCPAHEIHPELERINKHEYAKFRDFFKGVDLLLHGYRRSLVEEPSKDSLGNGAWEPVVDLASAAGVDRIALIPMAPDTQTDGLQFRIEERLAIQGSRLCYGVTRFNERVIL
jgi:CheY-like chemotaxis protein